MAFNEESVRGIRSNVVAMILFVQLSALTALQRVCICTV